MKVIKKTSVLLSAILALGSFVGSNLHAEDRPGHVGYDKGFYIKTDDDKFKLVINGQIQPQYQFLSLEGQDEVNTFQIRRGRLIFGGHLYTKDLTYRVQYEMIGGNANTTREAFPRGQSLRDAYVNYRFNDAIQVRAGQFKPAYNREEFTSSSKLQLVDRSIVNDVFSYGRDLGVAFHGSVLDKALEYEVFLTNEGNSNNQTNANNEMLFGGRLTYNVLGQHGYTMGDVENSEDHHLAISAAANFSQPRASADDSIGAGAVDLAYRHAGLSVLLEADAARDFDSETNVIGTLAQAGYFIVPQRFEIAARGGAVFVTDDNAGNGYEVGGGLSYYFFKNHNVKLQSDYAMLINSPLVFQGATGATNFVTTGNNPGFVQDQVDHRFRTQVQVAF